jgi:uncharacterized membrane protein YczE
MRPATLIAVTAGNWLYGTGEALFINANIGQTPGTVLAQGIAQHLGTSIAWATFYISVAVMLLWVPLRQAPGLGTLINIVLVSVAIGVMSSHVPSPTTVGWQIAQVLAGIAVIGIASGAYITSNLGAGPRDGLMTGLNSQFHWPIARVRLAIEGTLLISGWLLGGQVGIGTVLVTVLVGETVALCFGIAGALPEPSRQK